MHIGNVPYLTYVAWSMIIILHAASCEWYNMSFCQSCFFGVSETPLKLMHRIFLNFVGILIERKMYMCILPGNSNSYLFLGILNLLNLKFWPHIEFSNEHFVSASPLTPLRLLLSFKF